LPGVVPFKGYDKNEFLDAWSRYLSHEPLQQLHGDDATTSAADATSAVTTSSPSVSHWNGNDVTAVTDPGQRPALETLNLSPGDSYSCAKCGKHALNAPGVLCFWCR
jgi:hypothetical protein